MYKFIYKNKKTGEKVYSHVELKDKDLLPVFSVKTGQMKGEKIKQKKYGSK